MKNKIFALIFSTSFLVACIPENDDQLIQKNELPPASENIPQNSNDPELVSGIESSHPISLQALSEKEFNGSELKLEEVLNDNQIYTRHRISYKSGAFKISGIINIPKGEGPFPALILNHGHIDTSIYTNGRGLKREQDYFARNGYIVLHPDYRNHAFSDKDSRDTVAVRLGYIEDAINAIHALKNSTLPNLNKEKIGMLGHSMGGGVTLGAIALQPGLVQAAVLYAPVTGDMRDSYERWMSSRVEEVQKIKELYGSPEQKPEFWEAISSEKLFDQIVAPVRIFHGTADKDVPLEWSENTLKLHKEAGVETELTIYQNAPHEFISDWANFMEECKKFFDQNLKSDMNDFR